MRNAILHSAGMYVPERTLPNSYFDELLGEEVSSWLKENVQIQERRWCEPNQSVADLCVNAARHAMENGGVEPHEVDLLIIATDTPEYISPSTSSKVQYLLRLDNAGTFDVNSACAGFVTAFDIASKYIMADKRYNTVLVIGAYAISKFLNLKDKKTVTLFADGAGAVILKSSLQENRGFLMSQLITEGQYFKHMGIYSGGTAQPADEKYLRTNDHLLKFVNKFPKQLNCQMWSKMTLTLCNRLNIRTDDVDHYLFTQININSIYETLDLLGVLHNKTTTVMHWYGYTGSACIPMALYEALKNNKIKHNDLVFMIGSGGGLAFASAAFRY